MNRFFSRRHFLYGLGASACLLPLLNARSTRADAPTSPRRLIIIAVPNGVREDVYWPQGGEYDFKFVDDPLCPLKPLAALKNDLIFMGGIRLQNGWDSIGGSLGGHAALPFVLTGARGVDGPMISDGVTKTAAIPSIDQFIAKELQKKHALPFESLVLRALRLDSNDSFLSFNGAPLDPSTPNAPTPRDDPMQLYNDLFGGGVIDPAKLAAQLKRRTSVLDHVGADLQRFAARLGSEDKQKIEQHLDSIRSIEGQLAFDGGGCSKPSLLPEGPDYVSKTANPNLPAILKAQMDMTVAAMACDATRVATLLWSNSHNTEWVYSWLGEEFTVPTDYFGDDSANGGLRNHHEIAHHDGDPMFTPMANRVCQWYMEQYAYLLQKLKDTPDTDGKTMLDNTAVLYVNLQRTGGGHNTDNLPWLLGGSCGGYFKTGRFLKWLGGQDGEDVPQNGVLAALANAMGVPVDHYGDEDYGGEAVRLKG